jgi:membrane fusion protein, multidrug efflux system
LIKRLIALVIAIALVAVGVHEGLFWYHHVHEANARLQANFTVLTSNVNGKLTDIHATRGDIVKRGQLLASMDTRQAQLAVETLRAQLASERAGRAEIEAEQRFFLAELDGKIASAIEESHLLKRSYETASERMAIAKKNVDRNSKLESRSIVARQRVDDANDRLLEMQGALRELQSDVKMSEMNLGELQQRRQREAVYRSRIEMKDRQMDETAVKLKLAQQQLDEMNVVSPIDGVLNRVYINPGTYVEDGDPLLLLHDPGKLWLEAQVSESDIRLVKVGQSALVELDAYPYEEFTGTVRKIGQVTVGQIAAPSEPKADNSLQRVLVEIALPAIGKPVWPGMRAAVNIVVR